MKKQMHALSRRSAAIVLAMLAATVAITVLNDRRPPANLARPLTSLPGEINGWRSIAADGAVDPDAMAVLKPTSYLSRIYEKKGEHLGLFIAYYGAQHAGESMHSPRHCLPGAGWDILRQSRLNVPVEGTQAAINDDLIRNLDQRRIILYWYQSRRRIVADEFEGKFLLLRDALLEGRSEGSIVRIVLPDMPGMQNEGVAFAEAIIPQFQHCFAKN